MGTQIGAILHKIVTIVLEQAERLEIGQIVLQDAVPMLNLTLQATKTSHMEACGKQHAGAYSGARPEDQGHLTIFEDYWTRVSSTFESPFRSRGLWFSERKCPCRGGRSNLNQRIGWWNSRLE